MKSIANRIYRITIVISIVSVVTMLAGTLLVNEDLENTLLGVEMAEERDFFINRGHDLSLPFVQSGLRQTLVWQPVATAATSSVTGEPLPFVFQGLTQPFSGEIKHDDQTWLVDISVFPGGVLYLARDISHFEARERLFLIALWVVAALIVVLAVSLAVVAARGVVRPLRLLADQIQSVEVGPSMKGLSTQWRDSELTTIANAFNTFIAELEAYVRREKSLLSLASHELRTPIAVISGALDVLEQRATLVPADQATLTRVRRATQEMQGNINVLLALARKAGNSSRVHDDVSLATELGRVLEDLAVDFTVSSRVMLQVDGPAAVSADAVMVRMLLRNLLQNALQHTTRRVYVTVRAGVLEVRDEGPGLSAESQEVLLGVRQLIDTRGPVSGLGLYLVTLMAERLGWRLSLVDAGGSGVVICLEFAAASPRPSV